MKKGKNKGFSLIEILIGIGMLAVIVIPILHTFITSAQINRDSRQVMIQTEVAQTIMEGFAGKTYADVRTSVGELISNAVGDVVSGNKALSTIDGNLFNTGGTYLSFDTDASQMKTLLENISCNAVTWQGSHIETKNLVSDNSVMASMNQAFADEIASDFQAYAGNFGLENRIFSSCSLGSDAVLFLAYGNIHYEGYRFDAVVSFLPMASSSSDMYYTYRILLTLYEYKPEMTVTERFKHVLMTMDGGIMAGL